MPFHLANRDGGGGANLNKQMKKNSWRPFLTVENLFNFMAQTTGDATDVPAKM